MSRGRPGTPRGRAGERIPAVVGLVVAAAGLALLALAEPGSSRRPERLPGSLAAWQPGSARFLRGLHGVALGAAVLYVLMAGLVAIAAKD